MEEKFSFSPITREYIDYLKLDKSQHTIRLYVSSIDRFFSFLNIGTEEQIFKITPSDCRAYQAYLKETGLQFSSINSFIRPLKAFFNWIAENEVIEKSPFERVKDLKLQKKNLLVLRPDEINAMMNACRTIKEKAILNILLSTGVRREELVSIKISDIDGYTISILGKGNKFREVYMPDSVVEIVEKYLLSKTHKSEFLFSTPHGKMSTEAIRLLVKRIALRAGIDKKRVEGITPHTMRRTLATSLAARDINIRTIQGVLGHENENTTMQYTKLSNAAVERVMRNNNIFEESL